MKNVRTTLAGAISAAASVMLSLVSAGTVDAKTLILAGGLAAVGWLARDGSDPE